MIFMCIVTLLIAIASLSYAVYKGGECDSLRLELAVARHYTKKWADAYYEAIRDEGGDGADA